jgi:hypothetical protein
MYRRYSRNSKTTKTKNTERNEIIGALNNHQTETAITLNREINELRTKTDNIKEEVTDDMEYLRKKNETDIQNKIEGHVSKTEQTEDRISKLEDETEIKGKTEELLVRQLKTCRKKNCKNSMTPSKDQT